MTLPNFLIIGAAKSGTTSLWAYLRQHPQVFLPGNKEPNFFAFEGLTLPPFSGPTDPKTLYQVLYKYSITDFNRYCSLFREAYQEKAIGEASVRYLYFPEAAKRIQKYIPNVKMIVMLRNPIDRLYSHYLMMKGEYRLEPLELDQALEQEEERIRNNWGWDWHYVRVGMYYNQVKRYLDLFSSEQIKILLYDDFCLNPLGVFQDVCRYIGVDNTFVPDMSQRRKQAYWPRSVSVDRLLSTQTQFTSLLQQSLPKETYKCVIRYGLRLNKARTPSMPIHIRESLTRVFKDDILSLQNIIDRKLPW